MSDLVLLIKFLYAFMIIIFMGVKYLDQDVCITQAQPYPGYNQTQFYSYSIITALQSLLGCWWSSHWWMMEALKVWVWWDKAALGLCCSVLLVSHTEIHLKHLFRLTHSDCNPGICPQRQKRTPLVGAPSSAVLQNAELETDTHPHLQ